MAEKKFEIYLDDYNEVKKITASLALAMTSYDVFKVERYESGKGFWELEGPRSFFKRWAHGAISVSDKFLSNLGETVLVALKLKYDNIDIRRQPVY